jgi:hypothetical protein
MTPGTAFEIINQAAIFGYFPQKDAQITMKSLFIVTRRQFALVKTAIT